MPWDSSLAICVFLVGKALKLIHHSMTILNLVLSCKIVTNF